MPTHLYLAPAAAGKTTWVLQQARHAARDLTATPRVLVATHLQARAARRRLAEMGGALGVRVLTFDRLYAEVLNAAGEIYVELSEPVQYRLIRAIIDTLTLDHYAPLVTRPGFIQVLQRLIGELKAARVHPDEFTQAVRTLGNEPRLADLALVYAAYQERLQAQDWADRAGLGWLAVEALEQRAQDVARDWAGIAVDGFDSLTPIQAMMLRALAGRVGELVITLTGELHDGPPNLAHRRFARTRALLEATLGIQAEPLPNDCSLSPPAPALVHLAHGLFRPQGAVVAADGAVELVEATDRVAEVRTAMRWLKQRIIHDGCRPGEVALLARHIAPYRPFIQQVAAEFGLPIRLVDGLPLADNPGVAALLDLLQTTLPLADTTDELALPRRTVVAAWCSPYFDWSALAIDGHDTSIEPGDADDLDRVARWGRVISGMTQWSEAFDRLIALPDEVVDDEERGVPARLPRGAAARTLRSRFERFVVRLTPPPNASTYHAFVGWLETLIGTDTALVDAAAEETTSLRVVTQARSGEPHHAARDIAALAAFKDVLRGLVWAEEAVGGPPITYARFLAELAAALAAVSYNLPPRPGFEEILVTDVVQARGLPFRAVAVLGMAEGEFPTTLREDPFLRDADRQRLHTGPFKLPLEPSVSGAEAEFFADTVTRPNAHLLLTRPRLADNGATWQASPYWEAVRRLVAVDAIRLTGEQAPQPDAAASWPELLNSLAVYDGYDAVREWAQTTEPIRTGAVTDAIALFHQRRPFAPPNPFDGDLSTLADVFADHFAPTEVWSASRLESYRSCPFAFFATHVLRLTPRAEPAEGLDAVQLGNIYHRIFEQLYQNVTDRGDVAAVLAALPATAAKVLDDAPAREGFRVTAWWTQSRTEIEANVRRSIEALAALSGSLVPVELEARFGDPSLVIADGDDTLRLHGIIDRVDRAPDGSLRIIDYKTGGPTSFSKKALIEGKKLQIPLYALAAEQALGLGHVVDGFYWHVQHAEASTFTLASFDGGRDAAMRIAQDHAWTAVRGARAGRFVPHPPSDGCPDYCPAAAFCWHYRPRR